MNNTLIAVLVVIVIGVVGWLAFNQGYFEGNKDDTNGGLEIQIGGTTEEGN